MTTDVHEILPAHHHDHTRWKRVALALAVAALVFALARVFVERHETHHAPKSPTAVVVGP